MIQSVNGLFSLFKKKTLRTGQGSADSLFGKGN